MISFNVKFQVKKGHKIPIATADDGSIIILSLSQANFIDAMMSASLTVTICSTPFLNYRKGPSFHLSSLFGVEEILPK
ncbi:MAG: hypothetical protein HQM08_24385 [Candidatus Riflebacteria bacterium]|nr:hypothetical protein [Candidatus Riflebacteria bacterium]